MHQSNTNNGNLEIINKLSKSCNNGYIAEIYYINITPILHK